MAALAFVAGMLVQCTGGGQDCTPGEEGCECVFAECVGDLVCQSAVCIDLTPGDDDTGATDSDPTTGASNPTASTDPTASTNPTTDPTAGTNPTTDPTASTDPTATTNPTNPTTDPTGATDDGGDTTNVTGATTVEPGVCGDGKVDAGEACDDANDVDGDGCNNDCQLGGALVFKLIGSAPIAVVGAKQGMSFSDECDGPLRGIGGGEAPGSYVTGIQGQCAGAAIVFEGGQYVLELSNGPALPPHGNIEAGNPGSVDCPAGSVVTGFHAYLDMLGIAGFEPLCSTLKIDPNTFAVTIGAPAKQKLFGGMGESAYGDAACPAGRVATGLLGFIYESDFSLVGLGLLCAEPVVES